MEVLSMANLSTGFIIVGAYADKLRRTLFAQLSDKVKSKEIEAQEVARAAAEVNQKLFEILVNGLKLGKGDVVRVRIDYELEGNSIKWKYETLTIDAFRRVGENEIKNVLSEYIK
jgi:hypothetical protein